MPNEYFDIIWPNNKINEEKFFIIAIFKNVNDLKIDKISITVKVIITSNFEGERYINFLFKQ